MSFLLNKGYTRHTSSCRCVGYLHSPKSLTPVSSLGFIHLPPSCTLNNFGYQSRFREHKLLTRTFTHFFLACVTCKNHASLFKLLQKKDGRLPADVARFKRPARITVAIVSDYSSDKKTPFINFLSIKRLRYGLKMAAAATNMLAGCD